jgi:putative hydrolase of the HAD superfamily
VRIRAVIFDLWETLVDFDEGGAGEMLQAVAGRIEADPEDFRRRWAELGQERYVGPVEPLLRRFGIAEEAIEDVKRIRLESIRRSLVPRPGAVETLQELRRRGLRLGMVSVCSEEVELAWPDTPFQGLFDAEVFSSTAGLAKPDPRAYLSCMERLGVEPRETLFVGDGANDELAGAERVGLHAVLIHREGEDPRWPEVAEWEGPRITSIPEILPLVRRSAR